MMFFCRKRKSVGVEFFMFVVQFYQLCSPLFFATGGGKFSIAYGRPHTCSFAPTITLPVRGPTSQIKSALNMGLKERLSSG